MPGDDLRGALEQWARSRAAQGAPAGGFVLAGLGSLMDARLRLAGQDQPLSLPGPSELLTLSGSVSADGAHLHMAVALADGRVLGGHVPHGNVVRTTVELLLAWLPGWQLARVPDPRTGHLELQVKALPSGLR